jgi:hypothetical protein
MIWKTMFPLNSVPPTLLTLMSKFSNAEKVCKLVRFQLLVGAETAFAFVLSQHPPLDLESIAQADVDVGQYFSAVKTPSSIIVDRLINTTEVDVSGEIPHEQYCNFVIITIYFTRMFGCFGYKFIHVYDVICIPDL